MILTIHFDVTVFEGLTLFYRIFSLRFCIAGVLTDPSLNITHCFIHRTNGEILVLVCDLVIWETQDAVYQSST